MRKSFKFAIIGNKEMCCSVFALDSLFISRQQMVTWVDQLVVITR